MFEILHYTRELDSRLDRFVNQESVNGTFLQTRQFLNYHPEGRFNEASFAIEKSGTLAVYFPGNEAQDSQGNKVFVSHQGSTFGGPIFGKAFYSGSRVLESLKFADEYFHEHYKKVRLKITPALFSKESPDLIEYALEHLGYTRHTELSGFTPLVDNAGNSIDPLENCNKECRRIFRQSEKFDLKFKAFDNENDLETFYHFLEISKAKHNVKPVHTIAELKDLQKRLNTLDVTGNLQERVRFRGIWLGQRYIAGMMFFSFKERGLLHAQYISPNDEFKEFQPTTCLYINILRNAAQEGFQKFSWGISTEEGGNVLNEPLFRFKESFGAKGTVNPYYTKDF